LIPDEELQIDFPDEIGFLQGIGGSPLSVRVRPRTLDPLEQTMKKILTTLAVAAAIALPALALAGESTGYRCTNQCPLAKQANEHRSRGEEAARGSETVRREVAKNVVSNLARI
jgi:hypothetical protein